MYLVTGGLDRNYIISTEVMSATGSSWSYVGNLPRAACGMVGISVNNEIFVTGKKQYEMQALQLTFDPKFCISWLKIIWPPGLGNKCPVFSAAFLPAKLLTTWGRKKA